MLEILVIDDHPLMRWGLQCMLDGTPDLHVVGVAADGAAALRQAQALQPAVVLLDVCMPVMDGIEATRRLKALVPCPVVVLLTATCATGLVRDAFAAGADGFLVKDVPPEQLLRALRDLPTGQPAIDPRVARILRRLEHGTAEPRGGLEDLRLPGGRRRDRRTPLQPGAGMPS